MIFLRTPSSRSLTLLCAVFLLASAILLPTAQAEDKPLVIFTNPASKNDAFFGLMDDFVRAAADDLGFDLAVYYGDRNHVLIDENVTTIFERERLPDYVLGMNARGSGENLLKKAEAAKVKTVFVNQSFLGKARTEMGLPGEKYKQWIFEYLPDDTHSGYLLAKTLIDAAIKQDLTDENGVVHIIAISGHETSSASVLRNKGLMQAISEYPNVELHQTVFAGWKRDKARELSKRLIARYPEVTVVWSASDKMAMGVCEAIREQGKKPGRDILTGGIDWATLALDLVENGDFTVTVGGHFMDGAWGLVMLYDFIHGVEIPRSSQSHFSRLTKENIAQYRKHFYGNYLRKIDFTKFSKYHNPDLKQYDFNLRAILDQLKPGGNPQ